MVGNRTALFSAWAVISLLAILHIALFGLEIVAAPDTLQVQYTPDDAYYYLLLAKNFPAYHTWTFDAGHSVTSGFHPLLAYLLSLVHLVLRPPDTAFVRCGLVLSSLVTTASLLIAWAIGLRLKSPSYMALLALLATSRNLVYNSVSMMEWSLALLLSVLYWICLLPRRAEKRRLCALVTIFSLGLLGSLARSEFGLLPLVLFLASLLLWYLARQKEMVAFSFTGLLGATVGLLLVFVNNYVFTGRLLQSSARMKVFWGQIYGSAHGRAVMSVMSILNLVPLGSRHSWARFILFGVISLLTLVVVLKAWRDRRASRLNVEAKTVIMLVASLLCLLGYIVIYSRSGSISSWYTATLIAPTFIVLFILSRTLEALLQGEAIPWIVSAMVLSAIVMDVVGLHPVDSAHAPMPHQRIMLLAGKDLGRQKLDGKVGSWNAGIIGYYEGGTIVNLDGLVNDGIYEYVLRNDVPSYLSKQNIDYVIDFENVFLDQKRRLRGGYDSADFVDGLEPVKVYDNGEYYWKRLTLYRVAVR